MSDAQPVSFMDTYYYSPLSAVYCDLPIIESRILSNPDGTRQMINCSGLLQTLSVYFKKIWLPYPYGFTTDGPRLWDFSSSEEDALLCELRFASMREAFDIFYHKYRLLFDEGILQTVPSLSNDQLPTDFKSTIVKRLGGNGMKDLLSGDFTLAVHACYGPKVGPELFPFNCPEADSPDCRNVDLSRALSLGWFKYIILLKYIIPRLPSLNSEQVLELRKSADSTRQSFVDGMSELSDEVERRLADGANPDWNSLRVAFNRLGANTYEEYRRKLGSKSYLLNRETSTLEPVAQIEVMPWTPKFWYMMASSFTPSNGNPDDKLNKDKQAFKFLYKLNNATALA